MSYTDVMGPLEDLSLPLDAAWGVLKTLSLVESKLISPESYSTVHERARRARAKRFNSPAIYQAMKVITAKYCCSKFTTFIKVCNVLLFVVYRHW